jgi:D-3-phosphoglycerate dehydrogenase
MNKIAIAITTASFGEFDREPLKLLEAAGFKVILNPYKRKLMGEEVIELCKDATGIIAGTEMLDAKVMESLPKLKVISRCGSGIDNVDCNVAKKKGIKVFNTADAPTLAVADLAVGLTIILLRKVRKMDDAIRNGRWEKLMGNLLYDKKVGIIGFGRIGKKVAELLRPFNCEITYADPFVADGLLGLKRLSIENLLKWADIITIHVSGKDKIIGKKELGLMKKGSWIINISRGDSMDEDALYDHLKSGHILGAALDVFQNEPYNGSLRELDNVILTPHIGSYAKEARIKMEIEAVKNLLTGLER